MIRLENATKQYNSQIAVSGVSLEVLEGETLVLLGTSGCGKTTTLKLINRLEELTAGTIKLAGTDIQQLKPETLRRQVGYVIQGAGLFPHYTIQENIAVVPRLLHWDKQRTTARTRDVLELVGMPPEQFLNKYPNEISGGQQQRVGLARALVADPPVILMDEPFGALDPITRASIRKEFKSLEALLRKTAVLVTHDVQEAFELGDRICLMDQGTVQQIGTPEELVFRPANAFVRQFLQEHLLQLQLQVLSLEQLYPFLPAEAASQAKSITISPRASALEAAKHLMANQQDTLTVTDASGSHSTTADFTRLMAAVAQYQAKYTS
ncbi:ABC transporter ATP-binding protein [Pontibacter sp. CAU 1760]